MPLAAKFPICQPGPRVIDRVVAETVYGLLEVGPAIAVRRNAIGYDERQSFGLDGCAYEFGGVARTEPRGEIPRRSLLKIRRLDSKVADP